MRALILESGRIVDRIIKILGSRREFYYLSEELAFRLQVNDRVFRIRHAGCLLLL